MSDSKDIYDMGLHEEIALDRFYDVKRVPGGWIYKIYTEQDVRPCFVPFNNEYQIVEKTKEPWEQPNDR